MKVLTIKKHTIQFFDSIRKLPIRRYQKFNKYMMIAAEVGDSIADYDKRMARALGYLSAEDHKSAIIELTNQRQALHNALEAYSPSNFALACMVFSINGKEYQSFEEDSLNEVLDKLEEIGFTKDMLDSSLTEVKKN
jgi:hypothetical protein